MLRIWCYQSHRWRPVWGISAIWYEPSASCSQFMSDGKVTTSQLPPPIGHCSVSVYNDVIKWKHFPRYWPFVRGIHRSPVVSLHKDQWRGTLMFYLICVWTNGWGNNWDVGDLRHHRAHYDVSVMSFVSRQKHGNGYRQIYPNKVVNKHNTTWLIHRWRAQKIGRTNNIV